MKPLPRVLIIDHADSFTYNLFQQVWSVLGHAPTVVQHDCPEAQQILDQPWDAIILSPGPGVPYRESDFSLGREALKNFNGPILGVCLGHQAMGCFSAIQDSPESRIVELSRLGLLPAHGKEALVHHDQQGLFNNIPNPFQVIRYHSWTIHSESNEFHSTWKVTAITEDPGSEQKLVMAIEHRTKPWWGVQFHPESIATEHGHQLIKNFFVLAGFGLNNDDTQSHPKLSSPTAHAEPSIQDQQATPSLKNLQPVRISDAIATRAETLAKIFFSELPRYKGEAFDTYAWLDSGEGELGLNNRWHYWVLSKKTHEFSRLIDALGFLKFNIDQACSMAPMHKTSKPETNSKESGIKSSSGLVSSYQNQLSPLFCEGYVSVFAYEDSLHKPHLLIEATHLWAYDRLEKRLWVPEEDIQWISERVNAQDSAHISAQGSALATHGYSKRSSQPMISSPDLVSSPMALSGTALAVSGPESYESYALDSKESYLSKIEQCLESLRLGESYELCLTTQFILKKKNPAISQLDLYCKLRNNSPAPFSAWIWRPMASESTTLYCFSPERFLKVQDQVVESKPIKGTRPRGTTPEHDESLRIELQKSSKDRSENLMIVDLLRNDLGRVCEVGSVHVPKLMDVESYRHVHQLVSTIRGRLKPDATIAQLIASSFPGGSMTGAPKQRSIEILKLLENRPRGYYSGALGWIGLDGNLDLNIVIRTIEETQASGANVPRSENTQSIYKIGAGGAITIESDPEEEWAEVLTKASALVRGLSEV